MSYISTTLPKYLAKNGIEVHLITTNLAPYFQRGSAKDIFGENFDFGNPNQIENGYHVHTLNAIRVLGLVIPLGFYKKLFEISPNYVSFFSAIGFPQLVACIFKYFLRYKLTIGNHTGLTALSFYPRQSVLRDGIKLLLGKFINLFSDFCIVPTNDCAHVASTNFSVSKRKIIKLPLPVDTEIFNPSDDEGILKIRNNLLSKVGINLNDFVILFSGKFSSTRDLSIFNKASKQLRAHGFPVSVILIGHGEGIKNIDDTKHIKILPFMPLDKLANFFRISDLGVWLEETTSFLDAVCCGLPLLLSSQVQDTSHLKNYSITYASNNSDDFILKLKNIIEDKELQLSIRKYALENSHKDFSGTNYAVKYLDIIQSKI